MATLTIKGSTVTLSKTEARVLLQEVYGKRIYNWPLQAKSFLTVEQRLYVRGYYKGSLDGPYWEDESAAVWQPKLPNNPHYMRGYEEGHWQAAQDI